MSLSFHRRNITLPGLRRLLRGMATVLFGHKGRWQLLSLKPTSIVADPVRVGKWAQFSLYAIAVNQAIAMAFRLFRGGCLRRVLLRNHAEHTS